MGLDHGTWTVLKYIFPQADVPVFQLSVDYRQPPAYHYQLGRALRKLRRKGGLIIGSGNIVHNLRALDWQHSEAPPYDWAVEFDTIVKQRLDQNRFSDLVNDQQFGTVAQASVPTNDRYLPMLYTVGLVENNESVHYSFEGFQEETHFLLPERVSGYRYDTSQDFAAVRFFTADAVFPECTVFAPVLPNGCLTSTKKVPPVV